MEQKSGGLFIKFLLLSNFGFKTIKFKYHPKNSHFPSVGDLMAMIAALQAVHPGPNPGRRILW